MASSSFSDVNDGLVLHYTFDADSGSTIVDQSGNGNDGAAFNEYDHTHGVIGQGLRVVGNELTFSTAGGYVMLPNIAFNAMDELTISMWIKQEPVYGGAYLCIGQFPADRLALGANELNVVAVVGNRYNIIDVAHDADVDDFMLVTLVCELGEAYLYCNGELVGQMDAGISVNDTSLASLGRHFYTGGQSSTRFTGTYDDVRVYDRALSEDEISDLYEESSAQIYVESDVLTNTLVVAGETVTRSITISNAGHSVLEFSFCPQVAGPDDGLVAYYPFNGNAHDESGNGNDGVVYGASLVSDRFGNSDSALYFDGIDDQIILSGASILDSERTDPFTQSFWLKTRDTRTGGHNMITKKVVEGTNRGIGTSIINGHIRFMLVHNGPAAGNRLAVDGLNTYNDGIWHLVTITYDGSSKASGIGIYVDGVREPFSVIADSLTGSIRNDELATIGARDGNFHYRGLMDDIRFYERVLSESEILELYAETDGDGLIAYFPFNANANDESGNGHDGTIHGATLTEDRFGSPDSAYAFDGINDYIDIGSMGGFKTVSMWVNQSVRTDTDFYFGHRDFRVFAYTTRNGALLFHDASGGQTLITTIDMDNHLDQWVHIVAVSDGIDSSVYVNGENVTTAPRGLTEVANAVVNLGRWPEGRHYFNGKIDDVRIYNRVLLEEEIADLYSENPGNECVFPDWLAVVPEFGTVAPGESMEVSVSFDASNLVAGDYVEHVLQLSSNDPEYTVVEAPVSMWVIPSSPEIFTEPPSTLGKSNEVAWSMQNGPVEYWVEAGAVRHCPPSAVMTSDGAPSGWFVQNRFTQNPEVWNLQSGWIDAGSYWYTGLRLNTIYQYRVKASVMSDFGRMEGEWSDWTASCQVPVILDRDERGVPGWWKRNHFGTEDNFIAAIDSDGDNLCDFDEYVVGGNPHDARSGFRIGKGKARKSGEFTLEWESLPGRAYSIYWSPDAAGPFELIETDIIYPRNSYTDTVNRASTGFYRVDVRLDE